MKTVFHANIDGLEVVLGFGEAFGLIDPMVTAQKTAPLIQALDETRQVTALNAQINARRGEARRAAGLAEQALRNGDASLMARKNAEYQAKLQEIAELEEQLPSVVGAFLKAQARIEAENFAYAHPPQGESLICDAQAADLQEKFSARGDGKALLMTGEYVTDLRGCDFWLPGERWQHKQIDTIGEEMPSGAIMPDQLTDEQREEIAEQTEFDRVAALSPEDRQAEADRARTSALTHAAQTRSELEIAGDKQALAKSQAQYKEALAGIAEKYGQ